MANEVNQTTPIEQEPVRFNSVPDKSFVITLFDKKPRPFSKRCEIKFYESFFPLLIFSNL